MKKIIIAIFISLTSLTVFSQATLFSESETETYYSGTIWGPEMQHYAYYFVRYAMAVPIEGNVAESPLQSGNWAVGASYKLKLLNFWDIGVDLAYENEFHTLKNLPNTRALVPSLTDFEFTRTYQNNLMGGLYNRFYFKPNRVRSFGWYVDLGGYISYVGKLGTYYKNNDDTMKAKIRVKGHNSMLRENYGAFVRLGYNQFALFARYNFADIFKNNTAELTHFSLGLQLNLVMF
ncbi:MAG: hypothetical protein GX879_11400 [Bacteroidales bacterium]|nr:hypothetical protein [Bacteroidales bacterium]